LAPQERFRRYALNANQRSRALAAKVDAARAATPVGFADALTEVRRALQPDLSEIVHDVIRAVFNQVWRARRGRDADDEAETPGASRFNASRRILEDCGMRRRRVETARSFQKHVRTRLPRKAKSIKIDAVDSNIE
jgi:hypothetical protein